MNFSSPDGAVTSAAFSGCAPCVVHISEAAQVSLALNASRGGIVSASPGIRVVPDLSGAFIDPAARILGVNRAGDQVTIRFRGGELETAPALGGTWTATGNTSGFHAESLGPGPMKF